MDLMNEIKERIKHFEQSGEVALKPYKCPAGKMTIGWGYNYHDRGFPVSAMTEILEKGFTAELADRLLDADAKAIYSNCEKSFAWFGKLNDARKAVVVDMVYQMGLKSFLTFKNTIAFMAAGKYEEAAANMVQSKWFKQSGNRSKINTEQMRTGVFQKYK